MGVGRRDGPAECVVRTELSVSGMPSYPKPGEGEAGVRMAASAQTCR